MSGDSTVAMVASMPAGEIAPAITVTPAVATQQSDSKKPRMSTLGAGPSAPEQSEMIRPKLRRNVFSFDDSWLQNFRQGFQSSLATESMDDIDDNIDTCSIISQDSNATDLSQVSAPQNLLACGDKGEYSDIRPAFDTKRRFSHGIVLNWLRGVNNPSIPEESGMRNANSTMIPSSAEAIKSDTSYPGGHRLSAFGPNPKKGSVSTRELNAFSPSAW